ncbi:MAG: hypothetical protein ABSA30_00005, partial [Candidatus Aminicenantales bacterium]
MGATVFHAVQIGPLDDGATFGNTSPGVQGIDYPATTDDVDAAGFALTQGTLSALNALTDLITGGGSLTITADFACPDVEEVPIINNSGSSGTPIHLSFGTSGVDPGCVYSGNWNAIDNQSSGFLSVSGDLTSSAAGCGAYNTGTWTDFSGILTNSAGGIGAYNNYGTWTDFSGILTNSAGGDGAFNNYGTWTDFSGTLTNNTASGIGAYNTGTWTDFSGTLTNNTAGYGIGAYNNTGTWTDFSGRLTNSGSGNGTGAYNQSGGTWTNFSGTLTNSSIGVGAYNHSGTWTDFSGTLTNSSTGNGIINYDTWT